jgi:hypothetical protein
VSTLERWARKPLSFAGGFAYRSTRKLANALLPAYTRQLTVLPDDIFLVSYPKSGNTWVRFLIGNLLSPSEPVTFASLERVVPEIYHHTNRELLSCPRPRVIKSHEPFDPRYPKVIYLVRDPRDVTVSAYHYFVKKGRFSEAYPIEQFLELFMNGQTDFADSWVENVASWVSTRSGSEKFLMIRYEDGLANPTVWAAKLAAFLGIEPGPERLQRAIELSSARRMRESELREGEQWATIRGTRKDIPFIRTARAGGWRKELPESCVFRIESAWGKWMTYLGYELATQPAATANSPAGVSAIDILPQHNTRTEGP